MTTQVQLARADQLKELHIEVPFAYNTAGLIAGLTLYTPAVGDALRDAWIEITTAWNGTTPGADIGTFVASTTGLFQWVGPVIDLTAADVAGAGTGLLFAGGANKSLVVASATQGVGGNRLCPSKFTATNPLKVCVSTTGATDGSSPGASQGAAIAHLLISKA